MATKTTLKRAENVVRVHQILDMNRGQWIHADDLSVLADIDETHASCPNTRAAVRSLVLRGSPIVSGRYGFVFTRDKERIRCERDGLVKRMTALAARIDALGEHL